jgi:sigma-E factor negative regulatory protein RseC
VEELAEVVDISDHDITVVSQVKSTCNTCSQAATCASGQVAKAIPHKKLSLTLPYPESLNLLEKNQTIQVGDCVMLTLPEAGLLQSAWQVYLLPILGLILFSAIGQRLLLNGILSHELLALLLGMFGGYLGYRLAKYWQSQACQQSKLQPKILRVLPNFLDIKNENFKKH